MRAVPSLGKCRASLGRTGRWPIASVFNHGRSVHRIAPPLGRAKPVVLDVTPAAQNGRLLGVDRIDGFKWIQSYGGPLVFNPLEHNVGLGKPDPTHRPNEPTLDRAQRRQGRQPTSFASSLSDPGPASTAHL